MFAALKKSETSRQPSVIQAYLSANIDRVNALYAIRDGHSTQTGVALRTTIARELFAEESVERQEWPESSTLYE